MYIYILITFAWLHAPRKSQHPTVFGLWSYRLGNRRTPTKPLIPLILLREIGFLLKLFLSEASGNKMHQSSQMASKWPFVVVCAQKKMVPGKNILGDHQLA